MARMLPPMLDPECRSPGEQEIFRRLKKCPDTNDWVVLHSLDVSNHVRQVSGEADFVIIVPRMGVLCLEVKAHRRVSRYGGLWYYGSDTQGNPRSPFKQAAEAMHSIRHRLVQRKPHLSRVMFWSAVIFPYVRFEIESDEWHSWQVIDSRLYRSTPIDQIVKDVLCRARTFLENRPSAVWIMETSGEPDLNQCEEIVNFLRPDFETYENASVGASQSLDEARRFTEEQFTALDAMEANDRVIFTGPAGTGKTVLALESAKRSAKCGRRVLLLCFNRLLCRQLEQQINELEVPVTVRTVHAHIRKLAKANVREGGWDIPDFWQSDLPDMALETLLDSPENMHCFDEIIIDEAQDMLRDNYLDILDLSFKGGFGSGRWRMFGDFEKQQIYTASNIDLETFVERRGNNAPRYELTINCRNTPRIGIQAELLGGLQQGYSRFLRPDDKKDPIRLYYENPDQQDAILVETLERLQKSGYTGEDIVVLSPYTGEKAAAGRMSYAPWKDLLVPYDGVIKKKDIRYCSIHSFKGLEAPVVIVTDIATVSGENQHLLYVAVTRALHELVVIMEAGVKRQFQDLLISREGI